MALPHKIAGQLDITFATSSTEEQIIWDNSDGVVDNFAIARKEIQGAGELIYDGLTLHDLVGNEDSDDANYSIKIKFMGTDDLQVDIRVRRQDANNFIALKIDFMTDTIELVETIAGVETSLDQASHDFKFEGKTRYDFEIMMLGTSIHGVVNDFEIVEASTTSFRTEPGLSISFPTFNENDPPVMYTIYATETEAFPDPQPDAVLSADPTGFLLTFRESIKEQIENPTTRDWDSYVTAVKFYEQRNVGMSDKIWEELGYPIKKPSAEEWFGNLP